MPLLLRKNLSYSMQISLKNTKDNKNWISINFIWAVIVFTPIGLTYLPTVPQYSIIRKKVHYSGKLSFVETEHEWRKSYKKNVDFNQGFPQKVQFRCFSHTYPVISKNFTNFPLFWPLCYYLTNLPPASFAFAIWKCIYV